jgi:hypothetical protein
MKRFAIIFIVFLWAAPAWAADTPRLPLAYETSTLGVDYATMEAWEAAKVAGVDMVTAQMGQVLILPEGTYTDWVEINSGGATDADYFPVIKAADGATVTIAPTDLAHVGNYGGAFNYTFAVWKPYTKIIGINVDWTGLIGVHNDWLKTPFLVHTGIANVTMINCTAKAAQAPSYIGAGFAVFSATSPNNYFINCGAIDSDYGFAFFNGADGVVYNCTAKENGVGFYANSSTPVAKNCLAAGNTTDWSGTFTKTTCVDGTPTYAAGTDFDLDPTDTVALGQGTDLSADATWAYSYDLHDATRPTTWSVGADDSAEASPSMPMIFFFQ